MRLRILSLWHETVKPIAKQRSGIGHFARLQIYSKVAGARTEQSRVIRIAIQRDKSSKGPK
jgi:hypothetical protein